MRGQDRQNGTQKEGRGSKSRGGGGGIKMDNERSRDWGIEEEDEEEEGEEREEEEEEGGEGEEGEDEGEECEGGEREEEGGEGEEEEEEVTLLGQLRASLDVHPLATYVVNYTRQFFDRCAKREVTPAHDLYV